jgi:uncharacterized protein (TIGR02246 family)
MPKRLQTYETPEITVTFAPDVWRRTEGRMKRSLFHLLLVTIAVVALSCKPETTNVEEVRKAIEEADLRFAAACNAKDVPAVMSLFAPDPVVLPQNAPAVTGRANVEALWKPYFQVLRDMKLKTVGIDASGDLACTWGEYIAIVESPGMPAAVDSGKFLDIWKRQPDGKWLIAVTTSNTSVPAPPRSAATQNKK